MDKSSRAGDYSFVLAPMCFCPREYVQPVRIRVANGVVASVTYVESGKTPEHDGFGRYVTVDGLFAVIQEGIDRKASRITVSYDPGLGYPKDVSIDYVANMADEEYAFTAANFSAGAPEPAAGTGKVSGTITYRERMALGPDATVEVELRDVSLQDAPSITIAKVTITNPGQVPSASRSSTTLLPSTSGPRTRCGLPSTTGARCYSQTPRRMTLSPGATRPTSTWCWSAWAPRPLPRRPK